MQVGLPAPNAKAGARALFLRLLRFLWFLRCMPDFLEWIDMQPVPKLGQLLRLDIADDVDKHRLLFAFRHEHHHSLDSFFAMGFQVNPDILLIFCAVTIRSQPLFSSSLRILCARFSMSARFSSFRPITLTRTSWTLFNKRA